MKADIYRLNVTEGGALGMVHGFSRSIIEINISSLSISLNTENNDLNCFIRNYDRYKDAECLGDIEIPENILDVIKKYLEVQKDAKEVVQKWFNEAEEIKWWKNC